MRRRGRFTVEEGIPLLVQACAGIAGALMAQTSQFVALETLSFGLSAEVLIMLLLGGAGHRYGGEEFCIIFAGVERDTAQQLV